MLELYHADHSVCAQKVRLALAEKKLDWHSHILDLMVGDQFKPAYRNINPGAVVPTLVHDGRVVIESAVINEYIDDEFPDPALRPADALGRARMRLWTKQLDEGIHAATGVASHTIAFLPLKLRERSAEEVEAELNAIPDPGRRQRQLEALRNGLDSRFFRDAVKRLDNMLADMETALAEGPWLAGEAYSLADAGFTPYVLRLYNLRVLEVMASRPRVAGWFDRIRARPNYEAAITAWWNPAKVAVMNETGTDAGPKIRDILGAG